MRRLAVRTFRVSTLTGVKPMKTETKVVAPNIAAILDPLNRIINGDFTISEPTDSQFGWTIRGTGAAFNDQGILTEDAQLNSGFSQTFIVPAETRALMN